MATSPGFRQSMALRYPSKPMNWRSMGTSIWEAKRPRRCPWLSLSFCGKTSAIATSLMGLDHDAEDGVGGDDLRAFGRDQVTVAPHGGKKDHGFFDLWVAAGVRSEERRG